MMARWEEVLRPADTCVTDRRLSGGTIRGHTAEPDGVLYPGPGTRATDVRAGGRAAAVSGLQAGPIPDTGRLARHQGSGMRPTGLGVLARGGRGLLEYLAGHVGDAPA